MTASAVLVLLVSVAAPVLPVLAVPVEVGYRDHSYAASGVSAPTAEKPQSKLWFADGSWWGALYSVSAGAFTIWRLDWASQTWSDSGVVIDTREAVNLDALWDSTHLYVASHGKSASGGDAQMRRFSYNPTTDTYSLDAGFPVQLVSGGMEAGVIDKDTTGTVWFTYTRSNAVWVTRTNGSDLAWIPPYVIPTSGANNLTSDDISAVVAYDGKIGVMWSNANDWAMHFAIHVDGAADSAWTLNTAVREPEYSDDHMNLKSLQTDGEGRVYAVTKTSLNASSAPLMLVLILDGNGNWQRRTFGTVADNHTRPLLLIDNQNRQLYVFAASPCCSGGIIYYKQTPLDNVNFAPGKGTPFIQSSTDTTINNIASTKQPLNATTGLVAIAGDDHSKRYLHNAFALGTPPPDTTPPETTITSGPSGDTSSTDATFAFSSSESGSSFACSLDGGTFAGCSSPTTYTGLAPGPHTFAVAATDGSGNTDPTPATRAWNVVETGSGTNTYEAIADAYISQASPGSNFGSVTDLSSDGGSGIEERALVKFNVTGAGASAVDARLRFFVTNSTGNGPQVFKSDPGWSEGSVTWNAAPALIGGAVANPGAVGSGWQEVNVTSAIAGDGAYSFTFVPESTDGLNFSSRETTNHPQLIVTWGGPDTTPPETTITSGPSGDTGSASATFEFTSSEANSTFACSLDGGAAGGCTSPTTYPGLVIGPHTFTVAATDPATNTDPTPASQSWNVVATTSQTFQAVADAYVQERRPTTTAGSATTLIADGGSGVRNEALVRFDVSGLAQPVASAKLRIWVTNGTGNGPQVLATQTGWIENTVTWNTKPAVIGGALADAGAMAQGAWFEFDVTAAVTGNGTYSFILQSSSTDALKFASRETATRPELVITWNP
jgi:hypothetical protein